MGWDDLANIYPAYDSSAAVWATSFGGGTIGRKGYAGCLKIGANSRGLFVGLTFFPFVDGVFVPWSEVEYSEKSFFWSKTGRFTFRKADWAHISVPHRVAQRLLAARP